MTKIRLLVLDSDAEVKPSHTHRGDELRAYLERRLENHFEVKYLYSRTDLSDEKIEDDSIGVFLLHASDLNDRQKVRIGKHANPGRCIGVFSGIRPAVIQISPPSYSFSWQVTDRWIEALSRVSSASASPPVAGAPKDLAVYLQRVLLIGNEVEVLGAAIHALENLILPIRVDCETLEETGKNPEVARSIWLDYFGGSEPTSSNLHAGYLGENMQFEGCLVPGIENAVIQVLLRDSDGHSAVEAVGRSCETRPYLADRIFVNLVINLNRSDHEWPAQECIRVWADHLGISAARELGRRGYANGANDLAETLRTVQQSFDQLITALRWVRDTARLEEGSSCPT